MDFKVVKLINILEEKFEAPIKTNGENILLSFDELMAEVKSFWYPEDSSSDDPLWEPHHLLQALAECHFDGITKMDGSRTYIIRKK